MIFLYNPFDLKIFVVFKKKKKTEICPQGILQIESPKKFYSKKTCCPECMVLFVPYSSFVLKTSKPCVCVCVLGEVV